ncbi:ABC transporter permease subunit [Massilia sp. CCM 8733]|uniref:ABC transporter permease subunit n=1 Tax=Massilia mucilaginosa TaxID=2609282 RepID=A0ABX0NMC3_9BURK|nr:ABC transporter permease [Massilia mucilaginosa]NHZ87936.1 ABC transporter permease subunit [Massilia mucilaginosa]
MWTVYFKELLELLRDRKTFIFTLLLPIVAMPMIFGGLAYLSSTIFKKAQHKELSYAVFGKEHAPGLSERFKREKGLREVSMANEGAIKAAIDSDRITFAIVIPAGFEEAMAAHRQARVTLHYNNAVALDMTHKRVAAVIETHNRALREQALSAMNMSQAELRFALNPIELEELSTAGTRERVGSLVGGFLPYILLMVCLMAAMYPAIDLGAGEKERGTLETLLLAPISRTALVLAKFLVLFTVGLTSALLMVASMGLLLAVFGGSLEGGLAQMVRAIGARDLAMVALMLVPTAAIFASILLSISIYAKSYKEASGMISPLMMLLIVPIVVAMMPGVELNWFWSMVPLTNVSLAMKELVKGTMDYRMFSAILLSTTLIAGALLAWCRWWFNREDVLFRN